MSVLTDPTTYGILNSELTKCPRTAAVLGELAAQWQQMMGSPSNESNKKPSSQSLAKAIESIGRTRTEATAVRLRLKDGERLYPKSRSGTTPLGGFAREVAAWLGYIDPTHEAGKLIQRITKGTLRATEAWTDGRHAEDGKHVELDYELAVGLGERDRRRSNSYGPEDHSDGAKSWVCGMASLVDGYAPKSSNDPGYWAAHTRDAQEVQGRERAEGKAHSVVT